MKKIVNESLSLNEGFATTESTQLGEIASWLGYEDFEEFIGDNPGCYEVIMNWIDETFGQQLVDEGIEKDELERVGLYGAAELTEEN